MTVVEAEKLNKKENDNSKEDDIKRGIIETLIYLVISAIIVICIRSFLLQHVKVDGTSMDPTLKDAEHILVEKVSYKMHDVERFDIVIFQPYADKDMSDVYYVKRVIGLPGEKVRIEDGKIYINGEVLEEDYGANFTEAKGAIQEQTLGEGEYFVLGDNREVSKDSREIGAIKGDSIMGKAWIAIWPTSRVGNIED